MGRSIPPGFFSLVAHGGLIVAGLTLTAGNAEVTSHARPDTRLTFLVPRTRPEAPTDPAHRDRVIAPLAVAPGHQTVGPPLEIPDGIPPVDLDFVIDPRDYTGRGITGGFHGGVPGGPPRDAAAVYVRSAVDNAPEAVSCPSPVYPRRLALAGVTGIVTVRFVVTASGSFDRATFEIITSDHHDFDRAVANVLERCRFRPGSVGGRPVNVLVEQRFEFGVR